MKFQRSTVILVGIALLLGAGVLIAESQRARTPDTAAVSKHGEPILGFSETDVATLTVERNGETLVFQRGDDGNWQMTQPESSPAEPGAIAFLLSRLNTDAPLQTVTMDPDRAKEFGFTNPVGTVTVTLQNGTEHRLILGGPDFSGNANYAVIDPPTWPPAVGNEAYTVLVVTRDIANGINRPRDEWTMPVEEHSEKESSSSDTPNASDTSKPSPSQADSQGSPAEFQAAPAVDTGSDSSSAEPAAPQAPGPDATPENPSKETN